MNATDTTYTIENVPNEISIMLKGNHGIGKSNIVKQAADNLGIPMIDFRLSQNDVGDLKGIPFQRNGRTVFAPPEFMPITEKDANELKELLGIAEDISLGRYGDKGILFLDEINRASREVQQAAFELVLDRRMNLRNLPDGWKVITAINDNDDLYTVGSLDPAFVSRFMVIDFNPTYEEWMAWAREEEVHDSVITFITKYSELLDPNKETIDEATKNGVSKLYDRRSWHRFSTTIKHFEDNGKKILSKDSKNLNYLHLLAAGFIGSIASSKFRSFIENDYESLSAKIILHKWDNATEKKLMSIVDAGRIPELAAYNELIINFVKKNGEINAVAKKNLSKYVSLMPKEVVAGFWQAFNLELRALSEEWYNSDKGNSALILAALVNPDAIATH